MPSLGHVAVGLAAGRLHAGDGRPRLAAAALYTALATFPDLDVLARALGAGRGSPWLHRGALHALPVAALAGVVAALAIGGLGRSRARTALLGAAVAASHGLLDTLTHGGGGVMLLWPFDLSRHLAPWALLPAAPLGLRFLSHRGIDVLATEAILFLPLLVYALWPGAAARRGPSVAPPLAR
jgi:inner membrane protein